MIFSCNINVDQDVFEKHHVPDRVKVTKSSTLLRSSESAGHRKFHTDYEHYLVLQTTVVAKVRDRDTDLKQYIPESFDLQGIKT